MTKHLTKMLLLIVVVALTAGTAWFATRVESVRQTVHHHANIAIYIEGERLDISADKYMEDIGACKAGSQKSPNDRVHFHQNNMDTVHVHDDGVTWGHLMSNLTFAFSREALSFDGGQVIGLDGEKRWTYLLNGQKIFDPFNQEIRSTDRLLLTYGQQSSEDIAALYEQVSDNAGEYNGKYDPGTCMVDAKQNVLVKAFVEFFDGHDMEAAGHTDHE